MAHRRRRHHRRRNPHRRHHRHHRHHLMLANRHRNPFRRHRRHRNPSFGGMTGTDLLYGGGAALVNGILCRWIPQQFASQYNTGVTGYAMNVGVGAVGAWAIGKWNRRAGFGAWIGMVVAVGQRIIAEKFGAGTAAATAGMSGDLDFDLGYYTDGPFPFPQGSGGPYNRFPGTPYVAAPQFPATAASAVRAGQAAAAAALPAAAPAHAAGSAASGMSMDRWTGSWS